ncbi:MAG: hypothetical protein MK106_09075 [Mariniblastus sp.]|nr:hypothetical protein [Mariniblastus sp.]
MDKVPYQTWQQRVAFDGGSGSVASRNELMERLEKSNAGRERSQSRLD